MTEQQDAPPEYRLTWKVTPAQIRLWVMTDRECVVATQTAWWSLYDERWMPYRNGRMPCDPRGSMLVQGSLKEFWRQAIANPSHYGPHGIDALVAAFHGNVEVKVSSGVEGDGGIWKPTSFHGWPPYNELVDVFGNSSAGMRFA